MHCLAISGLCPLLEEVVGCMSYLLVGCWWPRRLGACLASLAASLDQGLKMACNVHHHGLCLLETTRIDMQRFSALAQLGCRSCPGRAMWQSRPIAVSVNRIPWCLPNSPLANDVMDIYVAFGQARSHGKRLYGVRSIASLFASSAPFVSCLLSRMCPWRPERSM
jgi:hypothetical protein